jgi:hypothetical protein
MDHRLIDQRSLAFGRAIADKLVEHPEVYTTQAKSTIARWLTNCSPRLRPVLQEWQSVLSGPVDGVIALLTGTDERSTRLRQSNPFAGALSNHERNTIIRQFESYDAKSA